MREILFRGKRKDNGEWVKGDLRHGGYYLNDPDVYICVPFANTVTNYPVDPETVGQFTGLYDNGTKIFEGDIVVCKKEINGNWVDYCVEIGFVEMKHGAFGLHRKKGYYRPFKDWLEDYEYEVIGNIHDNPELLERKTE